MSACEDSWTAAYRAWISGSYLLIIAWRLGPPFELNSKGFEGLDTMIIYRIEQVSVTRGKESYEADLLEEPRMGRREVVHSLDSWPIM